MSIDVLLHTSQPLRFTLSSQATKYVIQIVHDRVHTHLQFRVEYKRHNPHGAAILA